MSSIIGKVLKLSLFGESHQSEMGFSLDGLKSGIEIDDDYIQKQLLYRRPYDKLSTPRIENDNYRFISGYFNNKTTGSPLTCIIKNENIKSSDYNKIKDIARPSHADYVANVKYEGFNDYRGGGHFSGRITTNLVIAGSICAQVLKQQDIKVSSHILQIKDIKDDCFSNDLNLLEKQIDKVNNMIFPVINDTKQNEMKEVILKAKDNHTSVGGIIETVIYNVPVGIGQPFFDSIESYLSQLLFSIPGIKGVEFGLGFDYTNFEGHEVNDELYYENNKVYTKTNNNGGINGGISNGMPIIIKCVIKPTSSININQNTINMNTLTNTNLKVEGRHDPSIVSRVRAVIDSVVSFGILDLIYLDNANKWKREI